MAQARNIRMCQYLDDWVIRARDNVTFFQDTLALVEEKEENVLPGQHLYLLRHVQIFTDASNEGWCAHLREYTTRGGWSIPESKLHINFMELKAVLLAFEEFEPLCRGRVVLVASDNITVVAYINKEEACTQGPSVLSCGGFCLGAISGKFA